VLELSLAADDRRELADAIDAARLELQRQRDDSTARETRLAERELSVSAKRLELGECERILTQGSEALLALRGDIKECEGQIEYGRREREALAALVETRGGELAELREQQAAHGRAVAQAEEELASVDVRSIRASCCARRGRGARSAPGFTGSSASARPPTRRWWACSPRSRARRIGSRRSKIGGPSSRHGCATPTRCSNSGRARRHARIASSTASRKVFAISCPNAIA
jgi:hypothetical protein